jgi:hypothetical protein
MMLGASSTIAGDALYGGGGGKAMSLEEEGTFADAGKQTNSSSDPVEEGTLSPLK